MKDEIPEDVKNILTKENSPSFFMREDGSIVWDGKVYVPDNEIDDEDGND